METQFFHCRYLLRVWANRGGGVYHLGADKRLEGRMELHEQVGGGHIEGEAHQRNDNLGSRNEREYDMRVCCTKAKGGRERVIAMQVLVATMSGRPTRAIFIWVQERVARSYIST